MNRDEKNELLLTQLILMFQTAALQHMGKLKNPMTDTVERDLGQAQISIDMLEMINVKTKGNLTDSETRMMASVLQDLRLNYVDEVSKQQTSSAASGSQPGNDSTPKEQP
jgi:hypothetical protein